MTIGVYIDIYVYNTDGIKKSREFIKKNGTNEHLKKDVVQQPKMADEPRKKPGVYQNLGVQYMMIPSGKLT